MQLEILIEICKRYQNLGFAVQRQLTEILDDACSEVFEDQNPNALKMIVEFLQYVARHADGNPHDDAAEIAKDIQEFLAEKAKA